MLSFFEPSKNVKEKKNYHYHFLNKTKYFVIKNLGMIQTQNKDEFCKSNTLIFLKN